MKQAYLIRYLRPAENDLIDIFDHIKTDNLSAAISLLERFDTAIAQLSANPFIGHVPRNKRLKSLGYRILIVDKYLVFYVVKKQVIQIRRVIHGARQYQFLL